MNAMYVKEVMSHLDTSQENVDISIMESTSLNNDLLNVVNDNTAREG